MTSTSPTDPEVPRGTEPWISYLSGRWIPHQQVRIEVDDIGFRQGVIAVERLRTYRGKLFQVDAHLRRWQHTTSVLGINELPSPNQLRSLLSELLERNHVFLQSEGDVGITIFATPGLRRDPATKQPTLAMHLNRIEQDRMTVHQRTGQPLITTDVRQVAEQSWPRAIKVRSRIHYFLADQIAHQSDPDAIGVLVDDDLSITETSVANIAIVESSHLFSPMQHQVLGGITQAVVEKLADASSIRWLKEKISIDRLRYADEVLLMGTDGGLWFANSVDGHAINDGRAGAIYTDLRRNFDALVT